MRPSLRTRLGIALLGALILLASWLWPYWNGPGFPCLFEATLGVPCPGCGMTRAFSAIPQGHFAEAWRLHPFSFLFYGAALASLVVPFLPIDWKRHTRFVGFTLLTLALAMFAFGIARWIGWYPWP